MSKLKNRTRCRGAMQPRQQLPTLCEEAKNLGIVNKRQDLITLGKGRIWARESWHGERSPPAQSWSQIDCGVNVVKIVGLCKWDVWVRECTF
jgi:hypothetical protein